MYRPISSPSARVVVEVAGNRNGAGHIDTQQHRRAPPASCSRRSPEPRHERDNTIAIRVNQETEITELGRKPYAPSCSKSRGGSTPPFGELAGKQQVVDVISAGTDRPARRLNVAA